MTTFTMSTNEVRKHLKELLLYLSNSTDFKPSVLMKHMEALEIALDMADHVEEEMGQAHDFNKRIAGDR